MRIDEQKQTGLQNFRKTSQLSSEKSPLERGNFHGVKRTIHLSRLSNISVHVHSLPPFVYLSIYIFTHSSFLHPSYFKHLLFFTSSGNPLATPAQS